MSTQTLPNRQLSQEEIDAVFHKRQYQAPSSAEMHAPRFDFLRPDRIPAAQLRAIRLLHENFSRSLASSLSAYLRCYVVVNLVSFEQLSYAEFIDALPSPTVVVGLNLRPYEGSGVLEISPSSFFPILELLLGGNGEKLKPLAREITDIEQRLIEMLLRVIVQDLRDAWKMVAPIEFAVQTIEKEPQFLQILAPSEAVVAIRIEIRVGDASGALNIAIPSLVIKMMRQRFDQQCIARRGEATVEEQMRMMHLLEPTAADMEISMDGPSIRMRDLLRVKAGDVLITDMAAGRPVDCQVNGKPHYVGHLAQSGRKCVFVVDGTSPDA